MEFTTINEIGDIRCFDLFRDVINASKEDPTIWKIAFTYEGLAYRWVKKIPTDIWSPKMEARLNSLSEVYHLHHENMIFWVQQQIIANNYYETMERNDLTLEEKTELNIVNCITEVLSYKQFINRFRFCND